VEGFLGYEERGVGLIVRAISFQDFQPILISNQDFLVHQRHRQMDRRTDGRHAIAIRNTVHRAVKKVKIPTKVSNNLNGILMRL